MVNCSTSNLIKLVFGTFAVFLALTGIALFAVSGVLAAEFRPYVDGDLFRRTYLWGPVAVAIVLGIFLLLLGVFGVVGVLSERKTLIKAFIGSLILLIILEVVLGVLVFVFHGKLADELQAGIEDGIGRAYGPGGTDSKVREALDTLQKSLSCCGGNGTTDYTKQNISLPATCCATATTNCTVVLKPQLNTTQGCATKLSRLYRKYANLLFDVAISFAILEVFTIVFASYTLRKAEYSKLWT